MILRYHASVSLASSQQPSPTASTSHTSLRQPTIAAAFSAITPYEKETEARQRNKRNYSLYR